MRLLRMAWSGFRSFRTRHEIRLETGPIFFLGDNRDDPHFSSNASGKTSVCSVIPWVLYGELSTGAKKDKIINRDCDEVFGELEFEGGFVIQRTKHRKDPERLKFYPPRSLIRSGDFEERWYAGDLEEFIQPQLERILGISKSLFFNSVWIDGQSKSVQFLWATPGARLTLLEELLDDHVYAAARQKAEEHRKRLERDKANSQARIASLGEQEDRERSRLAKAQIDMTAALQAVSARRKDSNQKELLLRSEIAVLEGEVQTLQTVETPDSLNAAYQALTMEEVRLRGELDKIPLPPRLPAANTRCPTCFQHIPEEHIVAVQTKAEAGIARRDKIRDRLKAVATESEEIRVKQSTYRSNAKALNTAMSALKSKQQEMSALKESRGAADPYITSLQASIEDSAVVMGKLQVSMKDAAETVNACNMRLPLYKFWEVGFSAKGIRSLLLDDIRTILAYHVDVYAAALGGDQFRIEFPSGDKGFEILLHTPNGLADLATFSRGEVWRASMVVLLAIRKAIQYLNACPFGLLFLDDPMGDLDDAGGNSLVALITDKLSAEFDHIFVTLPRRLDNIPNDAIITVVKSGGASTLATTEEVEE